MLSTLTTLPPSVDSDVNIENDNEYLGFRGQKYQEIGVAEPTWAHGK